MNDTVNGGQDKKPETTDVEEKATEVVKSVDEIATEVANDPEPEKESKDHWIARTIFGVIWIVLGVVILHSPVFSTYSTALFIGWLMFIGGIVQSVYALFHWKDTGMMQFLSGILFLFFGLALINNLFVGTVALTGAMGLFFLIQGVMAFVEIFKTKGHRVLMFISGAISLMFSWLILSEMVPTSMILVGVLLGIQMIIYGFTLISRSTYRAKDPKTGQKILGIALVAFIIAIFAMQMFNTASDIEQVEDALTEQFCTDAGGNWVAEHDECEYVAAAACELVGGDYTECESACRHAEDEGMVCTSQCVPVCSL